MLVFIDGHLVAVGHHNLYCSDSAFYTSFRRNIPHLIFRILCLDKFRNPHSAKYTNPIISVHNFIHVLEASATNPNLQTSNAPKSATYKDLWLRPITSFDLILNYSYGHWRHFCSSYIHTYRPILHRLAIIQKAVDNNSKTDVIR